MRRSEQRRAAVFAVYQHDVTGTPVAELVDRSASGFTIGLAETACARSEELDGIIDRHSKGWSVDRIAPLERAIMRVAILEIVDPSSVPGEEPIPPEGAVNEAVETAKVFCGVDAPGFVNGILGAVIDERAGR